MAVRDSVVFASSEVSRCPQPLAHSHEIILQSRYETARSLMLSLLAEMDLLAGSSAEVAERRLSLADEVRRFEIDLIRTALLKARGSQTRAAQMLGVKTTTLNTKIKRYQIQLNGYGSAARFPAETTTQSPDRAEASEQ